MNRSLVVVTCVAILAAGAACASTAESPHETPVGKTALANAPTVLSSPTASAGTRATGIGGLDEIIAAGTAGDRATLQQRLRYTKIGCITMPQGIGAPPFCRTGEAAGTLVDVLPSAQCEGFFSRPDEVQLDSLAAGGTLYAVYRANPDSFPPGKYFAVFEYPASAQLPGAFALVTDDGSIVGIHFGCSQQPADFVQFQRLMDVVLPPLAR